MSQPGVPQTVYAHLHPEDEDPLPPVHSGVVYHYTDIFGLHGMIRDKALWASHIQDLNDPTERLYGWDVIAECFRAYPTTADVVVAGIIEDAIAASRRYLGADWFPDSFVLSASTEPDSLTQYRLYGQHAATLAGGTWTAVPARETRETFALGAAWRPVLYGPEEARRYVERMFRAAAAIIRATPPNQHPTRHGATVLLMLETLALHIKDESFRDEREVRLVFSLPRATDGANVRVTSDGRLVTYVTARPVDPLAEAVADAVTAVRLGPLAGSGRIAEAIQLHHFNHSGLDRTWTTYGGAFKLPVERTETRLAR